MERPAVKRLPFTRPAGNRTIRVFQGGAAMNENSPVRSPLPIHRRSLMKGALGALGLGGLALAGETSSSRGGSPIGPREKLTITKLETFLVKPRWLFLKV